MINDFLKSRSVEHRYASYDFCYLYFQTNRGNLGGDNMENSCMHLWSYLASWGMLRGSSVLLQRSPASLKPLIEYFDSICNSVVWVADVDSYATNKSEILLAYQNISKILEQIMNNPDEQKKQTKPSVTLITKIMLGVFGCVPAIDQYFFNTFHEAYGGFRTLGDSELYYLAAFYGDNQEVIDSFLIPVLNFDGTPTELYYKKAKLIDMYGFTYGLKHRK